MGLDHILLSKEVCQKLGIIPDNFPCIVSCAEDPTVMEVLAPPNGGHPETPLPCTPRLDGTSSCSRLKLPPGPPEYGPNLSASELKKLLISHYASSSFNRCTRQPLPMMRGQQMPTFIDPTATPVAAHTSLKVTAHWTDQVKAGLDRDVALCTSF